MHLTGCECIAYVVTLCDEPDDCGPCQFGDVECANGNCILADFVCDGYNDCKDNSDEERDEEGNCIPCPTSSHFQCLDGRCIEKLWHCNGYPECPDSSDEPEDPDKCPPCLPGQFRCSHGRCIYKEHTCDGIKHCNDGGDETPEACPCSDDELRCQDRPGQPPGLCVPPEWICDVDGIWDCPAGEDEANCTEHVKPNH